MEGPKFAFEQTNEQIMRTENKKKTYISAYQLKDISKVYSHIVFNYLITP